MSRKISEAAGGENEAERPLRRGRLGRLGAVAGVAATIAVTLLFHAFPAVDIGLAGLFNVIGPCPGQPAGGALCGDFPLRHDPMFGWIRQLLQHLPAAVAAGLAATLAVRLRAGKPLADAGTRALAVAVSSYALAVGLLVNGLLKPYSGRPRPIDTDLFGGALPFVPAGEWSTYCGGNCSFVSGEAAAAAWLFCVVTLLPDRYRRERPVLIAAAGLFVVATWGLRIAFGAHYLSDVIIAGLATATIFAILHAAAFPGTSAHTRRSS